MLRALTARPAAADEAIASEPRTPADLVMLGNQDAISATEAHAHGVALFEAVRLSQEQEISAWTL